MTEQLDIRSSASLRWLPPAAGLAIVLTGCLALIGWSFRVEVLKSVVPGMVTMKANTALAFVLAGLPSGSSDRGPAIARSGHWLAQALWLSS